MKNATADQGVDARAEMSRADQLLELTDPYDSVLGRAIDDLAAAVARLKAAVAGLKQPIG